MPSGDSWIYAATGLPSGLSINTSSGLISGKISAAPGAYAVSVTSGDGQGASAEQNFTWNVGATTSTVTSRTNHSVYGHHVILTATITPVVNGSGKPTGTVTFFDGTKVLHTVRLRRGKAKLHDLGVRPQRGQKFHHGQLLREQQSRTQHVRGFRGDGHPEPTSTKVTMDRRCWGTVALDNIGDATITETWAMPGKHKITVVYRGDTTSNLFQSRGDDSWNSRMVVAQTARQRSQGAQRRSAKIAQRERGCTSNLGMPVGECLGEGWYRRNGIGPKATQGFNGRQPHHGFRVSRGHRCQVGQNAAHCLIADVQGKQRC